MALVRRCQGFKRYAFSVAYDGSGHLGFSWQHNNENCITKEGSDLRALHSVEGKIRLALSSLVDGRKKCDASSSSKWESFNHENFQVSSRTDRGVHALKNTFHVDIRMGKDTDLAWEPQKLVRGLNFHLIRNARDETSRYMKECNYHMPPSLMRFPENDIRITSCVPAPLELLPNKHYIQGEGSESSQPPSISWNARFTATSRTYLYRILAHRLPQKHEIDINPVEEYGFPFEAGRSWRIHCAESLDLKAMKAAAEILTGTHDFTSFRGKGCYRSTPITTVASIAIQSVPLVSTFALHDSTSWGVDHDNNAQMVTVAVTGNAFLYRQVRNLVGCLASVGQRKVQPCEVETILQAKDRRRAPEMAPSRGLYLANVEHGDFFI